MSSIGIFFVFAVLTSSIACTQKAVLRGNAAVAKREPATVVSAKRDLQTTSIHNIWVVASNGNTYRLTIEGSKVTASKKWTGIIGTGGTRTYVTEGGFVAARWPYVYFIDPEKTPEGALSASDRIDISVGEPAEEPFRPHAPRICLASYQKSDNKRYLIAAWGNGRYREFQMADDKPYKPIWATLPPKKIVPQINGFRTYAADGITVASEELGWGYSCAIDQKRKRFYSQWYISGPKLRKDSQGIDSRTGGAIDLETGNFIAPETAYPNAAFVSSHPKLKDSTLGVSSDWGSYSVGTDIEGNIYNSRSASDLGYTTAHDPVADFIWLTKHGPNAEWPKGKITVINRKCLTTEPNCVEKKDFMEFHGPESFIGPLSALKDGTIVGLVRGSDGTDKNRVYLLRLEDESDLSKGIRFSKLNYEIDGDPYMYVDFTGATLYTFESEQTFKVREIPGYLAINKRNPAPQKIAAAKFLWNNKPGTTNEWQNIKLEARCYLDATSKPAYEEIKITPKAGEYSNISAKSCQNQEAEFIDIKLTRLKGNNLEDVSDIQISITQ